MKNQRKNYRKIKENNDQKSEETERKIKGNIIGKIKKKKENHPKIKGKRHLKINGKS